MIRDGVINVLILINHKVFIKMIGLKDQKKRLTSIKFEKNQKMTFYFVELKKIVKSLGIKLIYPDMYRNSLLELRQAKVWP